MRLDCEDRRCGTGSDVDVVTRQLGRPPEGMIRASARCSYGLPTAIMCSPAVVRRGAAEPFPTMYWLTCPYLREKVGTLEGGRHFRDIRDRLKSDPEFSRRVDEAASTYRERRKRLYDELPQGLKAGISESAAESLLASGPGGIKTPENIKCLHIYLANRLSGEDDPIGEAVEGIISSL